MHPLVAMLVGAVVAWAIQKRNRDRDLGYWRPLAGALGALIPSLQGVMYLFGAGVYWQMVQGPFWSLPLVPFLSGVMAAVVATLSGRAWHVMVVPVVAGHLAAIGLGMLTEEGLFPLAMLFDFRIGLGVLHPFDVVLVGVLVMTLAAGLVFRDFARDIGRLGLVCLTLYLLVPAYYAYEARGFGRAYAEAMGVSAENVAALPQPLSVLNWRVIVTDEGGRVHDTLVNLRRKDVMKVVDGDTRAKRIDALYRPKKQAVWRVYRRFGQMLNDTDVRRVVAAWHAWQETPYGWLGRYAVYEDLVLVPTVGGSSLCVQFMDLRRDGAREETRGQFVVCPARSGQARIFRPQGEGRFEEWVPLMGV